MAYPGITRVNGSAKPGVFHGGYQLRWYTVEHGSINFSTGYATTGSNFEKAVRAIENLATVVVLGTPTAAGFVVGVDEATYLGRGDNTGYASGTLNGSDAEADLKAAVEAAVGGTATFTEVALSGLTFA